MDNLRRLIDRQALVKILTGFRLPRCLNIYDGAAGLTHGVLPFGYYGMSLVAPWPPKGRLSIVRPIPVDRRSRPGRDTTYVSL